MKKKYLAVLIIPLLLIVSCGPKKPEDVASTLFELHKEQKYKESFDLYHKKFWEKTSKEKWLQTLKLVESKIGVLDSYTLLDKKKFTIDDKDAGDYYECFYTTKYNKYDDKVKLKLLFNVTIALKFFKPKESNELKILGHHISPQGPTPTLQTNSKKFAEPQKPKK